MNAFETYKCYLAIKRHFITDQYDYFRYNGVIKCSEQSFLNRRDVRAFLNISRHREPEKLLAANFIYGDVSWVGDIKQEYYEQLIKMQESGLYWFKNDLQKLQKMFNDNFYVGPSCAIPSIIKMLKSNIIDIHTVAIFEKILGMDAKWSKKPEYMIFQSSSFKAKKSIGFFNLADGFDKYIAEIKQHFTTEQLNN